MILNKFIEAQYKTVNVDDLQLNFKKLTWAELKDFEKKAKELDVVDVSSEAESTIELCKYIFENYIRDIDNKHVIDLDDVEKLPVQFCVNLLHIFVKEARGENLTEESIKKK